MATLLENLSIELIDMIFEYLFGSDIYFSFGNLNNRFNKILDNYHYFILDFRSISKFIFNSIIKSIKPSNICALTLSNGDETTGQIELFVSSWKLSDFVNLRLLDLHDINQCILSFVCYDIMKLSKLLILRIDGVQMNGNLLIEKICQFHHLQYLYIRDFSDFSVDINRLSTVDKLTHIDISCHVENIPNVFNFASSLRSVNLNIIS